MLESITASELRGSSRAEIEASEPEMYTERGERCVRTILGSSRTGTAAIFEHALLLIRNSEVYDEFEVPLRGTRSRHEEILHVMLSRSHWRSRVFDLISSRIVYAQEYESRGLQSSQRGQRVRSRGPCLLSRFGPVIIFLSDLQLISRI